MRESDVDAMYTDGPVEIGRPLLEIGEQGYAVIHGRESVIQNELEEMLRDLWRKEEIARTRIPGALIRSYLSS